MLQSMINAHEDEAINVEVGAPDKGEADEVLELQKLETTPRTKQVLEGYTKHLGKSKQELELEFIDQRKAARDKEDRIAEQMAKVIEKQPNIKERI